MNWHDLQQLLSRPIAFYPIFARVAGSITAGLFLSQAFYWSDGRTSEPDGSFFKTREEWKAETLLSRTEQETARARLRELGILEEVKKGVPCKIYFRINRERLLELIQLECRKPADKVAGNLPTGLQETCRQDGGNSTDKTAGNLQTLHTETTTETTAEISFSVASDDAASIPHNLRMSKPCKYVPASDLPFSAPGLTVVTVNDPEDTENVQKGQLDQSTKSKARFIRPSMEEVTAYCVTERGGSIADAEKFYDHFEANGWKMRSGVMKDWRAAVRNWLRRSEEFEAERHISSAPPPYRTGRATSGGGTLDDMAAKHAARIDDFKRRSGLS